MKSITKQMCIIYIKDYYKSHAVFFFLLAIFLLVALWFFTENIIVVAIMAALLVAAIIFMIYTVNEKIKNLNFENFYLVEDIIADFKKIHSNSKARGSGRDYIYTFQKYGKYTIHKSAHPTTEIHLHKEKGVDHLSVEKLCCQSCEKGDSFYLLIVNEKDKFKIIKGFPKFYFDIEKDDFQYVDGKYYVKK